MDRCPDVNIHGVNPLGVIYLNNNGSFPEATPQQLL